MARGENLAVGNDVVDLTDPWIARHHEDADFVARVCSDEERRRVNTKRDLWRLFAAKEAAYKALVKLGRAPGFAHRALLVSADGGSVAWSDCRLALSVTDDLDHVHAVAWSEGHRPRARVARADGAEAVADEGTRARDLLRDLVASTFGYLAGDLEVIRDPAPGTWDGRGPPRIVRRAVPLDIAVSLSHDGPFVAAATLVGLLDRTVAPHA
ncbi:MAG TPA: 4'-phosphopantetheinyl transferase superfamily protein [Polyangiaceae bacterium]|jgi:phosphopantetheinyl transferase (holo-ACP synthase)|nr:4'-phosphopantetheinyl transferase superfamily protein [Polyangiaceae bacterium]